ncbi:hypothetical protein [Actinomycetospora sp. CA-053990]|uniref:hypothetical protein n=1 Tax=Actinomycetospora sp. CA-053990 TaxID=3239891 RepID=UPI003D92BCDC
MDSMPPTHGPARHLDDLVEGLDPVNDEHAAEDDGPPADLPEVVEAVTGRARDLHELADRLSADHGEPGRAGEGGTLSAVALLRAHAGAVDDLAEHLLSAGSGDDTGPEGSGPRGVPRSAG